MPNLSKSDTSIWIQSKGAQLSEILNSGQIFHWFQQDNYHYGLIDHTPTVLEQVGKRIIIHQGNSTEIKKFLGLHDTHYLLPEELLKKDSHIQAAHQAANGVRLMNQPRWECLASFITSAMKQVSHIRQLSLKSRKKLGSAIPLNFQGINDKLLYAYPTPQQLANAGSKTLRSLGYGWRAETLHATAEIITKKPNLLNQINKHNTPELLKALQSFPGVGLKVASCVALFAYNRKEVFPLDVWTKRVLTSFYFQTQKKTSDQEFNAFIKKEFGDHAGYVQQLFFHAARVGKLKL